MPNSAGMFRVSLPDKDTDLSGGLCSAAAGATECYDHFGAYFSASSTWTQTTVLFSELTQQGWGNLAPTFDAKSIYDVQFGVDAGATFDLWIADLSFLVQ